METNENILIIIRFLIFFFSTYFRHIYISRFKIYVDIHRIQKLSELNKKTKRDIIRD